MWRNCSVSSLRSCDELGIIEVSAIGQKKLLSFDSSSSFGISLLETMKMGLGLFVNSVAIKLGVVSEVKISNSFPWQNDVEQFWKVGQW